MYRSIHDPRDPWAWRDQWTGEARTDYAELWVVIPLTIGLMLVALGMLIPLCIYKYCRAACPCQNWCTFFDSFLGTLHAIGRDKTMQRHYRSFHKSQAIDSTFPDIRILDQRRFSKINTKFKSREDHNIPQKISMIANRSSSYPIIQRLSYKPPYVPRMRIK